MSNGTKRHAEAGAWDESRLNEAFWALAGRGAPESLADETVDAIERERVRPSTLGVRHAPRLWQAVAGLAACLALVAGAIGFGALRGGPVGVGGDGFPVTVGGLAVVSVGEAAKAERTTTGDELLAVKGWLEASLVPSCPAPMPGRTYAALEVCGVLRYLLLDRAAPAVSVSHSSDSTSISCCAFAGPYLWVVAPELIRLAGDAQLQSDSEYRFPVVPVVLVGHFHDVRAADCATEGRETCEGVFVADQLAWVDGRARGPSVTVSTDTAGNPLPVHSTAAQVEAAVRNDQRVDAIVSMTAVDSASLHSVGASGGWGRTPRIVWFVRFAGPPPTIPGRNVKGSSGWAIVDDATAQVGAMGGWNLTEAMSASPHPTTPVPPGSGAPGTSGNPFPGSAIPSVSAAATSSIPMPTIGTSLPPSAGPSAACTPDQVTATAGTAGGASGQVLLYVSIANGGSGPCALAGWPEAVELRAKDGSKLAVTVGFTTQSPAPATVVLSSGGGPAATFEMWWANWCGAARLGGIVFTTGKAASSIETTSAPDVLPRCDNPDSPSTLSVGPFTVIAP